MKEQRPFHSVKNVPPMVKAHGSCGAESSGLGSEVSGNSEQTTENPSQGGAEEAGGRAPVLTEMFPHALSIHLKSTNSKIKLVSKLWHSEFYIPSARSCGCQALCNCTTHAHDASSANLGTERLSATHNAQGFYLTVECFMCMAVSKLLHLV